ncbi:type VI secretion system baseplate subunit TssG [Thalassoroseus pseudoceratinae]|uniref:type VI secretion system baseplate subunit TssG n=1 Tax=Thalassoroseus pseudoceratinae TaxID=2713176 RepID=UPI001420B771|nr:type VI secretion system baseplate subunit TssG [Thalassoroseus pseudoceratinae]
MGSTHRPTTDPVNTPDASEHETWKDELHAEPWRFQFLQVLRRLENQHAAYPRLGTSSHPADDPVRLRHSPGMEFSPANLTEFQPADTVDSEDVHEQPTTDELFSKFFGLLGPNGPLPLHLTEYALEREQHFDDPTFRAFLDVFHHRMMLLFYRAWATAQPTVQYDRPDEDHYGVVLGSLLGIGLPSQRNLSAVPDATKLHFAGHLSRQTRNAEGLISLLRHIFRVPVDVESFTGHWVRIPETAQTRLGEESTSNQLGVSAVLGDTLWDRQSRCRVILGPVPAPLFRRLLPGGDLHTLLADAITDYVGNELACDVTLILAGRDVPQTRLGFEPEPPKNVGCELGFNTWLLSGEESSDRDDLTMSDELLRRRTNVVPSKE